LKKIEKDVFNKEKPSIEHIQCCHMPEEMTPEMYIKVRRKVLAAMRHKIYLVIKDFREKGKFNKIDYKEELQDEISKIIE